MNAETSVQIAIVQYLRLACPGAVVFHCPNGGARAKREASILKAMGVLPGVSDLVILFPGGSVAFVEVKAGKGRASEAQTEFFAAVRAMGHLTGIVRSVSDMSDLLASWGVERRARAA